MFHHKNLKQRYKKENNRLDYMNIKYSLLFYGLYKYNNYYYIMDIISKK